MITNKKINVIISVIMAAAVLLTTLAILFYPATGISAMASQMAYTAIFDKNSIITMDISVDEESWNAMLENATAEEYILCDITINGTLYTSVGIRPKGNTSLTQVASSNSNRYSFKIEFDHYVTGQTCQGLDKMVVNNLQSDATYMKEYLSYRMLEEIGVTTPLYAFCNITVNGKEWGLYLAIESMEDSFVARNYGTNNGQLYKVETDDRNDGGDTETLKQRDILSPQELPSQTGNEPGILTGNSAPGEETTSENTEPQVEGMPPSKSLPRDEAASPEDGQVEQPEKETLEESAGENSDPGDSELQNQMEGSLPGQSPQQGFLSERENGGQMNIGFGRDTAGGDLVYTDDGSSSYSAIFDHSVFDADESDYARVIEAIKNLNEGTNLEEYFDTDQILRYIAANTVMVNLDSYASSMAHNYYLYESNGVVTVLPWDYNLSFAAFQVGSASDAVNFPIDTPVSGISLSERPLFYAFLSDATYLAQYHAYLQEIITNFFDSGLFEQTIDSVYEQIAPYVQEDATAFYSYEEFEEAVSMLKTYGLLRAESVQGQLDGTIPSTEEAQAADSSTMVDASTVDLTVMGTQGQQEMVWQPESNDITPEESPEIQGQDSLPSNVEESLQNKASTNSVSIEAMQQAQKIIGTVEDGNLTEEQISQLETLGFSEDEIHCLLETENQDGIFKEFQIESLQPAQTESGQQEGMGQFLLWIGGSIILLTASILWATCYQRRRYPKIK